MNISGKILIFQTAFIGDVILTLSMVQLLKKRYPIVEIDFVATKRASDVLQNHPDINEIIIYDKYGDDKGRKGFKRLTNLLKSKKYDAAIVPHRSIRSALLIYLSKIKTRIGFNRSAGRILFTHIVKYRYDLHEAERNISLLKPLLIETQKKELPRLYPSIADKKVVDKILFEEEILDTNRLIGIAPGSVWNTKRWTKEGYLQLVRKLLSEKYVVCLLGGKEDVKLCNEIINNTSIGGVINLAGKLTLLQSAELIRRCRVLITNDSSPVHLAAAVDIPVVAIFGATVPAFGFGPFSEGSIVVEINDLKCRPCAIHGGNICPIGTFDCMKRITHEMVFEKVMSAFNRKLGR
ncbi:MAG: lipopolysaccharide heptosyltransferase II [Bacteroidota bacterium]|nr:lipopolysaccharide heptosyltransferase II [Bacteroidota bacterium]